MAIQEVMRKSGKRYRAKIYIDGKQVVGQWHQRKSLAIDEETRLRYEVMTDTFVDETKKTLDECAELYFKLSAPKTMNVDSITIEKGYYRNHIKPFFGRRKITTIRAIEIQELWTEKGKVYTTGTIYKFHKIMNKIYKQMIQWGYVKNNVMEKVIRPRVKYAETEIWSIDEVLQFLKHAKNHTSYIVFYLAIHTGMRMSEILGLHWSDIDFDNNVILVTKSLNRKTKQRGSLKTKSSKRAVDLTDVEMSVLQHHKRSQLVETEIVCSTGVGTYFGYSNIRRAMKLICTEAKVKTIRFHDLRHTHATLLVEAGAPVKAVSERLGHADVRITLERYTHLSSKIHQETAKRFTDLLKEETETVKSDSTV